MLADPPSPQGCNIITCWLRTQKAGEIRPGCGEQHVRKYWHVHCLRTTTNGVHIMKQLEHMVGIV